ncbi:MAG: S8 family serine peptidase [Neisseriaceae bacterium]|nr:S8 family serine peptidase [Neisseriaceae bacterium]
MKFHHKTILSLALAACFVTSTASAYTAGYDQNGRLYINIEEENGQHYYSTGNLVATNINGLGNFLNNNRYDYAFAGLGNDPASQEVFNRYNHTQLEKDSMADKVASRESDFARVAIYDSGVDLNSNMINNRLVDRSMYQYDSWRNAYVAVPTAPIVDNRGQRVMHGTNVLSTVQELTPNVSAGVYVLNSVQDVGKVARLERQRANDNAPLIINMSAGIETRYNGTVENLPDAPILQTTDGRWVSVRQAFGMNNIRQIGQDVVDNNAIAVISSGNDSVTRYRQERHSNGVQTVVDNVLDITDDTYVNVSADALAPLFNPEYRNNFIVTTGVDQYGNHIFDSCRYHQDYCIAAPADITIKNTNLAGTSFAAPYVSGTLASIQNRYDWMTVKDLQKTLFTTATPMADRNTYGHGIVNYFKAVQGYGRFDEKTELNVNGQKDRYYFDNDISGNGYLVKKGDKSLVLNGNNTYTGGEQKQITLNGRPYSTAVGFRANNVVEQGELVLNGTNTGNVYIAPQGTLTVGDKANITAGTVGNLGTLNAETTSDFVINGALHSENATINKAVGSKIQVRDEADLNNANFNVTKIADGYVTQAGNQEVLLTANNISGNPNYRVNLPDLLTADMQQSNTQITANMKRRDVAAAYVGNGRVQFEGANANIQTAERYLKDMDTAYLGGGVQPNNNSLAMKLIKSTQLDKTLFENGTMTTHHAAEEINLNKQSHDLDFVGNLKHGNSVWIDGATDRNRLKLTGLTGKSEDYSASVGGAVKVGDGTIGGAIDTPHYRWEENFDGINKTVKADGVGVNVGYAHEFNDYRIYGALSYDRLNVDQGKTKNADGNQFGVVVGAGKKIDLDRLTLTPAVAVAYEQTDIDSIQINDSVRADDVKSRNVSAVAELEAGYKLVDNLRLTGKVGLAQDLHSKTRHTAVYDGVRKYEVSERETPKTRGNAKVGLSFSPTPNLDIGANVGYTTGKHWHRTSADVGLRYKF